jgi:hypothetical protein
LEHGPGWDAIDDIFRRLYPAATPRILCRALDPERSAEPCKQVVAWPAGGGWHLVGYGLTELFAKGSEIPDQDGWGYEITLRVPDEHGAPPAWAERLVAGIIRYVEQCKTTVAEGDWYGFADGLPLVEDTNLWAFVFVRDVALPRVLDTPFGNVAFRQAVGITEEEVAFAKRHGTDALVDRLRITNPLLETAPYRAAVVAAEVSSPMAMPDRGSTLTPSRCVTANVLRRSRSFAGEYEIELGASDARFIGELLIPVLVKGGRLQVSSRLTTVAFVRGKRSKVEVVDMEARQELRVTLADEAARELAFFLSEAVVGSRTFSGLTPFRARVVTI